MRALLQGNDLGKDGLDVLALLLEGGTAGRQNGQKFRQLRPLVTTNIIQINEFANFCEGQA